MDFEVSIDEHADSYSVVSVRGEVDLHTAPKVRYAIDRASEKNGVSAVVVDLRGTTFMDSTSLSTFMHSREELEERGISLRLTAPSEAVERIFRITGFNDYFKVFSNLDEAVSG